MKTDWFDSPLVMNALYWTFLGLMAIYISPMVLLILILLPGFISSPQVQVEEDGTKVTVKADDSIEQYHIKQAIQEARR